MKANQLLDRCTCGSTEFTSGRKNKIDCVECTCGIVRQKLAMTPDDLQKWYQDYFKGTYTHSRRQDMKAAKARSANYGYREGRLLDFGCGGGEFVEFQRSGGVNAWGFEPYNVKDPFVYSAPSLHDVHFPTDYFETITCHDVLEHLIDPAKTLRELHRMTTQDGRIYVEIPDFFDKAGKKHWKAVEHLWMWTQDQMVDLLEKTGFFISFISRPIPGKLLIVATKAREENRVKILVPPGVGDSYWCLAKLPGFIRAKNIGMPDVRIVNMDNELSRNRTLELVQAYSHVNAAGYRTALRTGSHWNEAYLQDGRTLFEDVTDQDYFMAYNGVMRFGRSLDDVDSQWGEPDWFMPTFRPAPARQYAEQLRKKIGDYFVAYFIPHGLYSRWLGEYPFKSILSDLKKILKKSGKRLVIVGGSWDTNLLDAEIEKDIPDAVNLSGQTSLQQAFELIRHSSGMIGYPSGLTIMATVFKIPTFMFWNDYYHEKFFWNSCPTESHNRWYKAQDTKTARRVNIPKVFLDMTKTDWQKHECPEPKEPAYMNPPKPRARRPRPGNGFAKQPAKKPMRDNAAVETRKPQAPQMPRIVKTTKEVAASNATKVRSNLLVICVLRQGGDFDGNYVAKLQDMVKKHLHTPHRFACLSDCLVPCERIPLKHNWPGFWSKLEIFRPAILKSAKQCLYLDLDTVLTGPIDPLLDQESRITMLTPWNEKSKRASGIMTWKGDLSGLYRKAKELFNPKLYREYRGDQDFICEMLDSVYGIDEPDRVQSYIDVASYKRDYLHSEPLPADVRAVCFHGKPRPHELKEDDRPDWMKENWV